MRQRDRMRHGGKPRLTLQKRSIDAPAFRFPRRPSRRRATTTGRWASIPTCTRAVVATDHDGVDYAAIAAALPIIIDTRNVFAKLGIAGENVVKA